MSHNLPHTILRNGSYIFNRRVPLAIQSDFEAAVVRVNLGRSEDAARVVAEKLSSKLEQIWSSPKVLPIDTSSLVASITPKAITLEDAVDAYLDQRGRGKGSGFADMSRLAKGVLLSVAGNKDIKLYDRNDARAFINALSERGSKTGTIRRRVNTIKAIFEHAYIEAEIEKRNPFARLSIPGEGLDAKKRGTFTNALLREIYREALASNNEIRLIVPILGETGARLAEIVGLRLCDVDLDAATITITPHPARRLKTRGSERELPLVGAALDAMKLVLEKRTQDDVYLFPRYERDGTILATHASNAINKWLKPRSESLTCHCLRHTMRDRLRAVGAPMDLIDQIGGWSSVSSVGSGYGQGYKIEQVRDWLYRIDP